MYPMTNLEMFFPMKFFADLYSHGLYE